MPIFDVLVVSNKKLIALERNHLNLCFIESESRIFDGRHLQTVCFFLYAIKCMLIIGVKLPNRYPFHEI
jgi:hypothetical protein